MFRRQLDALLFHSSTRLTTELDAAKLERATENARWRKYDEPTYLRPQWREELNHERRS